MSDIASVRLKQAQGETLEQTINRLIGEEQDIAVRIDQTLVQKEQYYQSLLGTGVRNTSNWQEPITERKILAGTAARISGVLAVSAATFWVSLSYLPLCTISPLGAFGVGTVGLIWALSYPEKQHSAQSLQRELLSLAAQEPALLQQKSSVNAKISELSDLYENLKQQGSAYRVSFKPASLVQRQYSKMQVMVENAGTGPAYSLTVLLEGQLEGETKAELGDLLTGKFAEAQLSIKPTASGQMKWQAKIVCKDILGREHIYCHPFWVEVANPEIAPRTVGGDYVRGTKVGGDFMPHGQKLQQEGS